MYDLISRQAAIDALMERFKRVPTNAIIAKDVIKNLPSIQPDTTTHDSIPAETGGNDEDRTSGDCISRQAAIDEIHEDADWLAAQGSDWQVERMERDKSILMSLPSTQPARKKGTWTDDASCPFCGFKPWYERDIHTLSFCPNCGADMREQKLQHADEETAQSGLMSAT